MRPQTLLLKLVDSETQQLDSWHASEFHFSLDYFIFEMLCYSKLDWGDNECLHAVWFFDQPGSAGVRVEMGRQADS